MGEGIAQQGFGDGVIPAKLPQLAQTVQLPEHEGIIVAEALGQMATVSSNNG